MSNIGNIVPVVSLFDHPLDPDLFKLIPLKMCAKHNVIPLSRTGSVVVVATSDPANIYAIDELRFITGLEIDPALAKKDEIEKVIDNLKEHGIQVSEKKADINAMEYDFTEEMSSIDGVDPNFEDEEMLDVDDFDSLVSGAVDEIEVVELDEGDDAPQLNVDAPIIKLVNGVLIKAIKMHVSDIHVEPFERAVRIRFRVDGVLRKVMMLPVKIKNPIISRLKIMSHLDISERRLPQDGRIKLKLGKRREMDFRVSSLPTLYGEKVVLRLLDKSNLQLDMTKLGFDPNALETYKKAINQPWGMVLVTGPTGSGKTTTLYSSLAELNKEASNIVTAEDPIEYNLVGINQVQMHESIGLNFASSLRSFLRQDPDIIMVGEVRDFETAEVSIKAALTGHLVLSTLHTNDAPSTVNRLVNMGVEPFLVSSSVNLILAQRLARKTCIDCKAPIPTPAAVLERMHVPLQEIPEITLYQGQGCKQCGKSGYRGRLALYEVMELNPDIKELIIMGATSTELKEAAVGHGMDTLRMAGIKKMKEELLSLDEVLRVTKED